jgi:PAS domain S-box-containing protein
MSPRKPPAKAAKPAKAATQATPRKRAVAALTLRESAEDRLRAHPVAPLADPDLHRVLHELQVHQVELELQNEQLRAANDELAALHARYHELYDFAPVAYFTVDVDRRIVELNLAGARLLGKERGTLVGKRLGDYVSAPSRPLYQALVARTLVRDEMFEEPLLLEPAGGAAIHVKAQAKGAEPASGGRCTRIVMVDVTALHLANDELARALEKFFHYWRP